MPINVNCVYNDRAFFCTNERIPKGPLGWLMGRRCGVYCGQPCPLQVMHPAPPAPRSSVPPGEIRRAP